MNPAHGRLRASPFKVQQQPATRGRMALGRNARSLSNNLHLSPIRVLLKILAA